MVKLDSDGVVGNGTGGETFIAETVDPGVKVGGGTALVGIVVTLSAAWSPLPDGTSTSLTSEPPSPALKVMHPHMASDPQYVERFLREARMAASINHPNVVTIHEVGQEGATQFIAMEFLPSSLEHLLRQ